MPQSKWFSGGQYNCEVIAEIHALKFYKGNCSVSFSFLFVVKMSTFLLRKILNIIILYIYALNCLCFFLYEKIILNHCYFFCKASAMN